MSCSSPQPVLASCSDEFYDPFSKEARTSTEEPSSLFEPFTCPTNRVHLTHPKSNAVSVLSPNFSFITPLLI